MRITSLRLKGVGPFEDTTIEFPPGKDPALADVYLLVGKNGCGKTTALQSLASVVVPGLPPSDRRIEDRFRDGVSAIIATTDQGRWGAVGKPGSGETELHVLAGTQFGLEVGVRGTRRAYFFQPREPPSEQQAFEQYAISQRAVPLAWAAFAYSGTRRASKVAVSTVTMGPEGIDAEPLNFATTSDAQRLAQWAANQNYRRLLARDEGNAVAEREISQSLVAIERAVSEIIDTEFAFSFSLANFNVRVRLGDVVTEFDLLPEGVKSIISWLGDLMMRLSRIEWTTPGSFVTKPFLLLLDEIEVHLHPAWQRKILLRCSSLFPNAQIIASTHSPFVVASLRDGAVIELMLDQKGNARARAPQLAPLDMSYSATLRSLFGIESDFDPEIERAFREFQLVGARALKGESGAREEYERLGERLSARSEELAHLVRFEMNQTRRLQRGGA